MKHTSKQKIFSVLVLGLYLSACQAPVHFTVEPAPTNTKTDVPIDTPIENPAPIIEPQPPDLDVPPPTNSTEWKASNGICSSEESTKVLSCMTCQSPKPPPQLPPLSEKAQALYDILVEGCQVRNKSDPKGYVPPTAEQLMAMMNRCSEQLYPETVRSPEQDQLIRDMTSLNPAMRKYMFGGLWYRAKYTERFERYFGLENKEARYLFCYGRSIPNTLFPIEYYQGRERPLNYVMPPTYVKANEYRRQLKACIQESLNNPWTPGPPPIAKKCQYMTLEGVYNGELPSEFSQWLILGYRVGYENADRKICGEIADLDDLDLINGPAKFAAVRCD